MLPSGVKEAVRAGANVLVEKNAAAGIGISDQAYIDAGAMIADTPEEIFAKADMIVKVKEPSEQECKWLKEGQVLFTYLHLAAFPLQTKLLLASGCTAIAYETVTDAKRRLPLLAPMSEIAGRLSIQAGAFALQKINNGRGVLLGGVPGVLPAKVAVIGGGVVGYNAARMAAGLGADVTIIDLSLERLNELDTLFQSRIKTLYSNEQHIEEVLAESDLVIGGVLIPGAKAPKLIKKSHLKTMMPGSVVVDVAIDQGGCAETSKPTTHESPTYVVDGVVHYCVANMPGAVARTSTFALCNATLPYIVRLIKKPWRDVFQEDPYFAEGWNVHRGKIMNKAVEASTQPV